MEPPKAAEKTAGAIQIDSSRVHAAELSIKRDVCTVSPTAGFLRRGTELRGHVGSLPLRAPVRDVLGWEFLVFPRKAVRLSNPPQPIVNPDPSHLTVGLHLKDPELLT